MTMWAVLVFVFIENGEKTSSSQEEMALLVGSLVGLVAFQNDHKTDCNIFVA